MTPSSTAISRSLAVIAVVLVSLIAGPQSARAFSCPPFLYADAYIDLMPVIFGGTPTKIVRSDDGRYDVVSFRVERAVKGTDGDTMTVAVPSQDAFGRYVFVVGRTQTVFVYPNTRRTLPPSSLAQGRTDVCAMKNAEKVRLDPATRGGQPTELETAVDALLRQ